MPEKRIVGDRILSWRTDTSVSSEAMPRKLALINCLIVFALAFGLRQITLALYSNTPFEMGVGSLASFGITLIIILFIRYNGLSLREHGFLLPKRAQRLLSVSLLLAFLHALVVIFVPGSISGFEAGPGMPISWGLLFSAGSIVLMIVAAETIFRGYIQTDLEKTFGSYASMAIVSILFTLYMLPVTLYFTADSAELVRLSLPLLAESLFLCFFFMETKTLICPIAFAATVTILETFTPLEPTAIEYTTLVSLISYIFLVPITQMLLTELKEQNARSEVVPELDSQDAENVDVQFAERFE